MINKDLLVIHHGALGDVVCAWPVFCALSEAFGKRKKFCLGREHLLELLQPLGFKRCSAKLEKADLAFYGADMPEECKEFEIFRFCMDIKPEYLPKNVHILYSLVEENVHVSEALRRQAKAIGIDAPNNDTARSIFEKLHGEYTSRYKKKIALIAGAGHIAKRWPVEYFLELAENFILNGYEVTQIMGALEVEQGLNLSVYNEKIQNTITKNLNQLIVELCKIDIVIGNDSGPMHVAGLCGNKTITFFGASNAKRWQPNSEGGIIFETNLPCAPCSLKMNNITCDNFACMRNIKPQTVWNYIRNNILIEAVAKF